MEIKAKKREWVKNVAIILLAVLLVLTFFSNTIMNRNLPEVATQYVSDGTINAKVRGTGTVQANGTHVVKAEQTREIRAGLLKRTGGNAAAGNAGTAGNAVFPPVVLTGGIQTAGEAEAFLENGTADLIGLGRCILNGTWKES